MQLNRMRDLSSRDLSSELLPQDHPVTNRQIPPSPYASWESPGAFNSELRSPFTEISDPVQFLLQDALRGPRNGAPIPNGQPIRPHPVPFLDQQALLLEHQSDLARIVAADLFEHRDQHAQRVVA